MDSILVYTHFIGIYVCINDFRGSERRRHKKKIETHNTNYSEKKLQRKIVWNIYLLHVDGKSTGIRCSGMLIISFPLCCVWDFYQENRAWDAQPLPALSNSIFQTKVGFFQSWSKNTYTYNTKKGKFVWFVSNKNRSQNGTLFSVCTISMKSALSQRHFVYRRKP